MTLRHAVLGTVIGTLVACTAGPIVPSTPWPPTPVANPWQAQLSTTVAGAPSNLILMYQTAADSPRANDLAFTARCGNCTPAAPGGVAAAPLTVSGRLTLHPEFCGVPARPGDAHGSVCWAGPVTFPSAGTWHLATPFDLDLQIEPPAGLAVSNGTTLPITVVVNGTPRRTVAVGKVETIPASELPPYPWQAEARFPSGRAIATLTVRPGDVLRTSAPFGGTTYRGDGVRVDLSCGRLDMWSGPPLLGPAPGPGAPGDCAP